MSLDLDPNRQRGLPAVQTMRQARLRGRYGRPTVAIALYMVAGVAAVLVLYRVWADRKLEQQRQELLSQVRAARSVVGERWTSLQQELEQVTLAQAATPYPGDLIEERAKAWDFRAQPGIYVRVRLSEAQNVDTFRAATQLSVRDGFTSCLLRGVPLAEMPARTLLSGAPNPMSGVLSEQPWNFKNAYQATRVLTDAWMQEVETADAELRLRAFEQQFAQAREVDIPRAVSILGQASFYLFVFDEEVPEAAIAEPPASDDGTPSNAAMVALQSVPHPVRVNLYDVANKKLVYRQRLLAKSDFVIAGDTRGTETGVNPSVQRQTQNCQLATDMWANLGHSGLPSAP